MNSSKKTLARANIGAIDFTHQIPTECLTDHKITKKVLNNISRYHNKSIIKEILGEEILLSAQAIANSQPNRHAHDHYIVPLNNLAAQPPTQQVMNSPRNSSANITVSTPHQSPPSVAAAPSQKWGSSTSICSTANTIQQQQTQNPQQPRPLMENIIHPESIDPFLSNLVKELVSKERMMYSHPLLPQNQGQLRY